MAWSSRQKGGARENRVADLLETAHKYSCYPSRGSRGLDLVCIAGPPPLPHLGIEVGGASKRIGAAFRKMRETAQCPGMLLLVVRELKRSGRRYLRWYASEDGKRGGHAAVLDAIAEAREL